MKYPSPKPLEVLNTVTKYKLLQAGYSNNDLRDTEQITTETILNVEYLFNPLIWIKNIFKKNKVVYAKPYITNEKIIITKGVNYEEAEALLLLHDEIKSYEEDEMKKSTKGGK